MLPTLKYPAVPRARRILRILRNAATILSLLLFLATMILWLRGFAREGILSFDLRARAKEDHLDLALITGGGGLTLWICSRAPQWFNDTTRTTQWHWISFGPAPPGLVGGPTDRPGGPIRYAGGWQSNRGGFGHLTLREPDSRLHT